MPFPPVIVDLPPADAASAQAHALVEACRQAVGERGCVASSAQPAGIAPDAVAIVSFGGEHGLRARIELGLREAEGARWFVRQIDFLPSDPVVERWRAVGYAIATLVGEVTLDAARAPAAAPPAPPPPASPQNPIPRAAAPPASPSWPRREQVAAELRLALGGDAEAGDPRVGPALQLAVRPGRLPVAAVASARYIVAQPDDALTMRWYTVGAGALFTLPEGAAVALQPRAELILDRFEVVAVAGERREASAAYGFGVRLGVDGVWRIDRYIGASIGVEVASTSRRYEVRVAGEAKGVAPWLSYAILAGPRLALR